jgi:glutaredoxin
VVDNPQYLEEMLQITSGSRRVPVLVEEGQVTIGFGGS